jgi:hypothetical protein
MPAGNPQGYRNIFDTLQRAQQLVPFVPSMLGTPPGLVMTAAGAQGAKPGPPTQQLQEGPFQQIPGVPVPGLGNLPPNFIAALLGGVNVPGAGGVG